MLQHRIDHPGEPPLKWMPAELLSASDTAINDRKDFLARKSLIPTVKEKKTKADMEMLKGTEVRRKLALENDEEVPQQPSKRAKQFTTTPAEMVSIFAQFAQATADGGQRRLNPIRTMETLVTGLCEPDPSIHQ